MASGRVFGIAGALIVVACGSNDTAPPDPETPPREPRDGGRETSSTPPAPEPGTYRASPVIVRAGVYDANETTNCGFGGGCVNAFFYFADAPSVKSGELPASYDGVEQYDRLTWASNFQGPNRYPNESERVQWEWSIDNTESTTAPRYLGKGECAQIRAAGGACFEAVPNQAPCSASCILFEHDGRCECSTRLSMENAGGGPAILTTWGKAKVAQVSMRTYPVVHAVETVTTPDAFTTLLVEVMEDDEGFGNDRVGSFELDRRDCKAVFDAGKERGWTAPRMYRGDGARDKDIAFVEYKIWCERR